VKAFHEKRRQQFLYEQLYENVRAEQLQAIRLCREAIPTREPASLYSVSDQEFVYRNKFWLWMLDYTAGVALDDLAPRLSEVVDEFELWHRMNRPFREKLAEEFPESVYGPANLDLSPVDFENQIWYQDALQLTSVAVLLRDARSAKRIIRAMDSLRGIDGLYEALIEGYVDDPIVMDETIHGKPYDKLLTVFDSEPGPDNAKTVLAYCKAWYKQQDGARWYDGHLKVVDDSAPYYGYWAFEAGAACFLLNIDDSQIDHMVYPKDLVAYGRRLREENKRTSEADEPLDQGQRRRALPGEAVPQGGLWTTPALPGEHGRKQLKAGDRLPDTKFSDWGEVIWYLDAQG
jgi:hypothetical protein